MKIIRKVFNVIIDIITTLLIIFIILVLMHVFQVTIFRKRHSNVFGYSLFHVLTESMEPTINIGDDVFLKITKNVKVNDIVVFDDEYVNDFTIHRVIKIDGNKLITRGDNNRVITVDVDRTKLIGKVLFIFPKLGDLQVFFRKRFIVLSLIDIIIIIMITTNFKMKKVNEDKNEKTKTTDLENKSNI